MDTIDLIVHCGSMKEVRSLLGTVLGIFLFAHGIHSFAPILHGVGIHPSLNNRCAARKLFAVADTPFVPAEFQDEEESIGEKSDDWIETKGGFIANLRTKKRKQQKKLEWIHFVDTIEDYKSTVVDEKSCIVVVRFFASWCRSCKASEPLFKRMAGSYGSDVVKFVEVPLTKETAYIQEGLGVPSVPYGHIYHPEVGLVEEMKISKPNFREFRDKLKTYVKGSCDLNSRNTFGGELGESIIGEFE